MKKETVGDINTCGRKATYEAEGCGKPIGLYRHWYSRQEYLVYVCRECKKIGFYADNREVGWERSPWRLDLVKKVNNKKIKITENEI